MSMDTVGERLRFGVVEVVDCFPQVCRADAVMWALGYEGYEFRSIWSSRACAMFEDSAWSCYCGKFKNPARVEKEHEDIEDDELPF